MVLFFVTTKASATKAPSHFSTGHITYSSGAYNVGNYSTTLSTAASCWNNALYANCCPTNFSLTSVVTNADVIASFTSSYPCYDVLGRVSLYATDIYGDPYTLSLVDDTEWEYGFLYVYPVHIIAKVEQSQQFDDDDIPNCITTTTVHEFGHILGLIHPEDEDPSVMRSGFQLRILLLLTINKTFILNGVVLES